MRELTLVLNAKAQGLLNRTLDFRLRAFVKDAASIAIFGGFVIGMFLIGRTFTSYLLTQAHIGQFLFHRLLSMVLYLLFITVNLGNVIVCYATLYRSEEVTFLMGLPISHENIFLAKFVDNFLHSSVTLVMLAMALLLGYGSVFHMPWHFYFLTMFALVLPFMLIAGIIAVMILMALIKVAARVGIRWLLTLSVGTYLLAVYGYFSLTNPVQLIQDVMKSYPDVNGYYAHLDPALSAFLPNHWVAQYLYWSVNGNNARALPYLLILNLVFVLLLVIATVLARRLYYPSWLAASDARATRGPTMSFLRGGILEFGSKSFLRPAVDALMKRDFWLFIREPGQWLHVLFMIFVLCASLASLDSLNLSSTRPHFQLLSFLGVFLFNGFLVASVALRFVFPSVSLEGESFWCVRASPVNLNRLYWQKFAGLQLIVLAVGEALVLVSGRAAHIDGQLVVLSGIVMAFVSLTLTSLHLGGGSYFANYKERNAIRVASSQGASLTFLVSILYIVAVVSVLWFAAIRYFESFIAWGSRPPIWFSLPVAFIAIISLLATITATWIGLRSFKRDY
jgi:ABC-2 type transport system permease protein